MIADFDLQKVAAEVQRRGCKSVGLQFPPGLMREAADAAKKIQETTDAVVLVSGQPTHGGCDIPEMPVDLIVNFGHSPMPYLSDAATFFVEIADDVDVEPVLEEAVTRLQGKAALIAAIEYVPQLPHAKRFLEGRGVLAVIGAGPWLRLHRGHGSREGR